MSPIAIRTHLLTAISQAKQDGFHHFADALIVMYENRFGHLGEPTVLRRMNPDVLTECRLAAKRARSPETFSADDHALLMRAQERNREREGEFTIIQ